MALRRGPGREPDAANARSAGRLMLVTMKPTREMRDCSGLFLTARHSLTLYLPGTLIIASQLVQRCFRALPRADVKPRGEEGNLACAFC